MLNFARRSEVSKGKAAAKDASQNVSQSEQENETIFPLETVSLETVSLETKDRNTPEGNAEDNERNGTKSSIRSGKPKADFLIKRSIERAEKAAAEKVEEIKKYSDSKLWPIYVKARTDPTLSGTKFRFLIRDILRSRYKQDIQKVARSYSSRKLPKKSLATFNDVLQCAWNAHLEAIEKYDPSLGGSYMQYLNSGRLRGRIIDGLRKLQNFPREVSLAKRSWAKRLEALSHELRRDPTDADIVDAFGEEGLEYVSDSLVRCTVLNQFNHCSPKDHEDLLSMDMFSSDRMVSLVINVEPRSDVSENTAAKDRILSLISDSSARAAVDLYYFSGMLNQEVAEKLGVSESQASTLRKRGEVSLRAKLDAGQFMEIISEDI